MSVNHGGLHVGVSEQFLHGADVVAGHEQMRCKAMAIIPSAELAP
jgi:hypothetical protein